MKVKILSDGIHAKECNKYGDSEPDPYKFEPLTTNRQGALMHQELWRTVEKELRTFEIENCGEGVSHITGEKVMFTFKPNTVHEAELVETGKIKIIS